MVFSSQGTGIPLSRLPSRWRYPTPTNQADKIGPFKGGLNNVGDPTSIDADELSVCQNFEFDVDGSLSSRPAIVNYTSYATANTMDLLGYYVDDATGTSYLIGSNDSGVYYLSGSTWNTITTGFRSYAATQYLDKMWIVAAPGAASNGGSWDPSAGFSTVASMPKGMSIGAYKDRLFVGAGEKASSNSSRLYFSGIADGTSWPAPNFIDIHKGDGQKLVDLFVLNNNIYLFKSDSTYVYSYDSAPDKGVVQTVSTNIGASGLHCVAQYQNYLLVYHEQYVYELINFNYSQLNVRLTFTPDFSTTGTYFRPVAISVVTDRLVVRYFDKSFVFNFLTRTWTQWVSTKVYSHWIQQPKASTSNAASFYVSSTAILNSAEIYSLLDSFDPARTESITCVARTKYFDFDSPQTFKRLFWWGVDVIAAGTVTAKAVPIVYNQFLLWNVLTGYTWNDLIGNLWQQPLLPDTTITTVVDTSTTKSRKFLKFMKAARFREIYFEFQITTDCSPSMAPVRLFSFLPTIGIKQKVSKQIS